MTFQKGLRGLFDHLERGRIAHEARRRHRPARERVLPERLFDNACRLRREPEQEHHVDERGVIGHNHLAGPAEALRALELVREHTRAAHEVHEPVHHGKEHRSNAAAMDLRCARQQAHQREHDEPEHEPAQPKHREAERGGTEAPDVRELSEHRELQEPPTLWRSIMSRISGADATVRADARA